MAKKQFKAEAKRLLDLMINSIYTHQEIFLREIISNASDAIDKLCYLSLTDDKVGLDRGDFKIEITVDKDARTLTVSDNGIGIDKNYSHTSPWNSGLHRIQELIYLLNGQLKIDGDIISGTDIRFSIPIFIM